MLRGLWRLTWLEIKIFVREPLGVVGTVGFPVLIFIALAEVFGPDGRTGSSGVPGFVSADLPVFASVLIAASAVMSLVTIIAIYREGGILKRLRATPLRPHTILMAHVLVKLLFTALTLVLLLAAGKRYYPIEEDVPVLSFVLALLFCTLTIVSLGFLIASVIPTARFAQPVGTLIVYPMLGLSGLFVSIEALPPLAQAVSRVVPFTYAVSLLRGIWAGEGWWNHATDVAVLTVMLVVLIAASTKFFRWE